MKMIKIQLEKTSRTDLICVSCGGFVTEYAIVRGGGFEPNAGIHRSCINDVHVRRATSPQKETTE